MMDPIATLSSKPKDYPDTIDDTVSLIYSLQNRPQSVEVYLKLNGEKYPCTLRKELSDQAIESGIRLIWTNHRD